MPKEKSLNPIASMQFRIQSMKALRMSRVLRNPEEVRASPSNARIRRRTNMIQISKLLRKSLMTQPLWLPCKALAKTRIDSAKNPQITN